MKRFKYTYQTPDMAWPEEFTVDEHDETIANSQAKLYVEQRVNPSALTRFDLVCVRRVFKD